MSDDALFGEADRLDGIVAALRRYPDWPADDLKDRAFAAEIVEAFPGIDIESEVLAWRTWMMDHETKKQVRPRARFLRWLRGARGDFGRPARSEGAGVRRTSTTARSVESFGPESRSLTRW
jgi:hypothetical protein